MVQRRAEVGGTGLGLTILLQAASLNEFKIQVETEPGKGSNFNFVLNLSKGKGLHYPTELGMLRVLLISNDDDLADNLEQIIDPCHVRLERTQTLESAEALIAGSVSSDDGYDICFWDKKVFGDDPTCMITRADDPSKIPYHVLMVPMISRQTLPELVVGCYERVVTTPMRAPVILECLHNRLALADPESRFPSDRVIRGIADVRSLAGKSIVGRR